ncbi:hypothetical protein B0H66DRAFT_595102 [Apodospora peruviana]|uniref:Uncharacterized protein n=1 Tax=Apodospora peruviana TaxID=516989 RepID=A0AAE0HWW9_9PEZI|nr:hypothetical protein B0H66DRAFT_595102 [Apodospora peruviana]
MSFLDRGRRSDKASKGPRVPDHMRANQAYFDTPFRAQETIKSQPTPQPADNPPHSYSAFGGGQRDKPLATLYSSGPETMSTPPPSTPATPTPSVRPAATATTPLGINATTPPTTPPPLVHKSSGKGTPSSSSKPVPAAAIDNGQQQQQQQQQFARKIEGLQQEAVRNKQLVNDKVRQRIEEARKQAGSLTERQKEVQALKDRNAALDEHVKKLESEKKALERETGVLEKDKAALEKDKAALENEKLGYGKKIKTLEESVKVYEGENKRLDDIVTELENDNRDKDAQIRAEKMKYDHLVESLTEPERSLVDITAQLVETNNLLESLLALTGIDL